VTGTDPNGDGPSDGDRRALERARHLLHHADSVLVLTGAGISTDSGIPDFRGPRGVWTLNPGAERLATLDVYMSEPDVRRRSWQNRLESAKRQPMPNAGHASLVELERSGKLSMLVTQNVDGLHLDAGNDPAKVVEIHGTMREVMCMRCDGRTDMNETLARVREGDEDPRCLAQRGDVVCGGVLKSATVSFGQQLFADDVRRAQDAAERCDLVMAVGTTLAVYPAAGLVPLATGHGAPLIIVNGEATELDTMADVVLRRPISEVLPELVARV
jgi:NAD-dependent deacetylase